MAKLLRTIHTNAGIRAQYKRKLVKFIRDMASAITYWTIAAYRPQEERVVIEGMAQDASPVNDILERLNLHLHSWRRKLDAFAAETGKWFSRKTNDVTTEQLLAALRDTGFTVKFDKRRLENNVVQALTMENVNLIKSLGYRYMDDVYGIVMQGMSYGRDVNFIRDQLYDKFTITERRAAGIARDQANKATQAIKFAKAESLGITKAVWVHIPGVKTSRHSHQQMDGKEYVIAEGMYDKEVDKWVKPGELPYCQCTNRWIIPEFGD